MKKVLIYISFLTILISFQGCIFFNDRGVSSNYYNDCRHYYDSRGLYREKCEKNVIDYKDMNPLKHNGNGTYYVDF